MTNSESLGAESATAPTTKPESADLSMSAGAEMLIERMKTNPEDFRYGGKFYRVMDAIQAKGQGWISDRDLVALRDAHDKNIKEAEFSEWVYGEIFNPKEEETPAGYQRAYTQNLAQSLAQTKNAVASGVLSGVYGNNALQNTTLVGSSPSTVMTVNANSGNPTLTLGQTALTESMLGQIKTKLGL